MEGLKADTFLVLDLPFLLSVFLTEQQHHVMYIDGGGVKILHLGKEFSLTHISCYLDISMLVSNAATWQGTGEQSFLFLILLIPLTDAPVLSRGSVATPTVRSSHRERDLSPFSLRPIIPGTSLDIFIPRENEHYNYPSKPPILTKSSTLILSYPIEIDITRARLSGMTLGLLDSQTSVYANTRNMGSV